MAPFQQVYRILEQYVDIYTIWHALNRGYFIRSRQLIFQIERHDDVKNIRI